MGANSRKPTDGSETESINGITVVPQPSREQLNQRQRQDYKHHRRDLITWMLTRGKNPDEADGYAHDTVRRRAYDTDAFYRWIWTQNDTYTLTATTNHADDYMQELALDDNSDSHRANTYKSISMLYRYLDIEWNPDITFTGRSPHQQTTAYLSRDERQRLRETVLEYDTVPSYDNLTPTERNNWKSLLAVRFRKPADAITQDDFQKANGFKYPSIFYTALDAGLRPKEVGRARASWVDRDNNVLRIPAEHATKSDQAWVIPLTERTMDMLSHWLDERSLYDTYEDSDRLWLTREAKPFSTRTLNYHAKKLYRQAGFDVENRELTFYAIRHSTGTYMTREEDLVAARDQLRRNTLPTEYDQTPVDERRGALDNM